MAAARQQRWRVPAAAVARRRGAVVTGGYLRTAPAASGREVGALRGRGTAPRLTGLATMATAWQ
jgi:hypothetical protein